MKKFSLIILIFFLISKASFACDITFINFGDKSDKLILPLSLSYDHRIINGADAARFCNEIKENLGKNFAYNLSV